MHSLDGKNASGRARHCEMLRFVAHKLMVRKGERIARCLFSRRLQRVTTAETPQHVMGRLRPNGVSSTELTGYESGAVSVAGPSNPNGGFGDRGSGPIFATRAAWCPPRDLHRGDGLARGLLASSGVDGENFIPDAI